MRSVERCCRDHVLVAIVQYSAQCNHKKGMLHASIYLKGLLTCVLGPVNASIACQKTTAPVFTTNTCMQLYGGLMDGYASAENAYDNPDHMISPLCGLRVLTAHDQVAVAHLSSHFEQKPVVVH